MPEVLGEIVPDVGAKVWKNAKAVCIAAAALVFEHVCLTKSRETGKDCKGVVAQKDNWEHGTCDCAVAQASSFVFYLFRNWEPMELL